MPAGIFFLDVLEAFMISKVAIFHIYIFSPHSCFVKPLSEFWCSRVSSGSFHDSDQCQDSFQNAFNRCTLLADLLALHYLILAEASQQQLHHPHLICHKQVHGQMEEGHICSVNHYVFAFVECIWMRSYILLAACLDLPVRSKHQSQHNKIQSNLTLYLLIPDGRILSN